MQVYLRRRYLHQHIPFPLQSLHKDTGHFQFRIKVKRPQPLKNIYFILFFYSNLSYLEGFSLLKRLNFSGNQLNPNTVIPELKRLKHIDLSNNKISDLNSLQIILSDMKDRFPKLKTLKLTKNPVAVMPDFSEIVKETFPSFKYDVKKDLFVYDESMSE